MINNLRLRFRAARAADGAEFEQGLLRLAIMPVSYLYFLVVVRWDGVVTDLERVGIGFGAMSVAFAVTLVVWMLCSPGTNSVRRIAGAVLDQVAATVLMLLTEEAGAMMMAMYLWVAIGNGFRFGRLYLHNAQALALVGFGLVLWLNDFWHQHLLIAAAFLITLLLVPWYVSLLVARLQEARADAEAANVAKTKFLAAASHDLRQPMQALSMYATVLEQRVRDDSAQRVVHGVKLSVTTLERMFDSLLDIARIESGVIRPQVTAFYLGPVIERLAEAERPIAALKNLKLHVVSTSVCVVSDAALLERMLKNLVTNAIRYTERGKIIIGCRRLGQDRVRIDVIDSGIGIALDEQQRIFDEYYQISGSSAQGLGLGLPIVKSLGELLSHPVSVRSAPGRGSVFSIELPVARVQAEATLGPSAFDSALGGLTIALVDDDVEIRDSMALLLESWGCRAVSAATVGEIEEKLGRQSIAPDAVIVDYRLAGAMNGIQVVGRLRELFGRHLPALIITGTANPAHLMRGIPFVMKPIAPGRLRAFLAQVARPQTAR